MDLTPEQQERNARWALVARRTHELRATTIVQAALNAAILTDPLDVAEKTLDQLADEPDPLEETQPDGGATRANARAQEAS